jgi:hypothetical protein
MEKYKGTRSVEKIIKLAKEKGYVIDKAMYEEGSDHIFLKKDTKSITINTFNGWFYVYDLNQNRKVIAAHFSDELDNEKWYQEILDLIYFQ